MLRRFIAAMALPAIASIGLFASSSGAAEVQFGGALSQVKHFELGQPTQASPVVDPNAMYSNVTTFLGSGVANGDATGTTVLTTALLADDLTPATAGAVGSYKFALANFNTAAVSARPRIRFYDDDGALGGPGTLLSAISFNALSIPTGVTVFNTGPLGALQFTVPSGTVWAGVFFDNNTVPATTAAQLNNLGLGVFNPPDVGTSQDRDFLSPSANQPYNANTAGTIRTAPLTPPAVANYGFELVAVPEPGSMMLVGAGLVAMTLRRRHA